MNIILVLSSFALLQASREVCSSLCITLYDPVCGRKSNGEEKTFGNNCNLDYENCLLRRDGGTRKNYKIKKKFINLLNAVKYFRIHNYHPWNVSINIKLIVFMKFCRIKF